MPARGGRTPGSWLAAGSMLLAGVLCGTAFVALIHAPLPEELLASLGHEAASAALGGTTR